MEGATTKLQAVVSDSAFEYGKNASEGELNQYNINEIDLSNLTHIWPQLMDHQKKAVLWAGICFARGHGAMLAMDTGTGKTLSTLAIMDIIRHRDQKPLRCMAFGPKAGLGVWDRDIHRFGLKDVVAMSVVRKNLKDAVSIWNNYQGTVILSTSYGNAIHKTGDVFESLAGMGDVDIFICDESHRIKTPTAKTTKKILSISRNAHHHICMTATPITRTIIDQGSQIEYLEKGRVKRDLVSARYWLAECWLNEHPQFAGKSIVDSMARADRGEFAFAVKKEDAIDLPGEIDVEIEAPWALSPKIKALYNKVYYALDIREHAEFADLPMSVIKGSGHAKEDFIRYDGEPILWEGHEVALNYVHIVSMLYRCSEIVNGMLTVWDKDEQGNIKRLPPEKSKDDPVLGDRISKRIILWDSPKVQVLKSMLEDMQPPLVVVGRYTTEMEIIRTLAGNYGYKHGEISGRIKDGIDANGDMRKDLDLVSVSIGAGSESIDLTRANNVIYFGVGYNYSHYYQMRGRAYRIGQTQKVTNHILRTKSSMDDHVWLAMNKKEDLVGVLEAEFANF